jgi:hypothetical protein
MREHDQLVDRWNAKQMTDADFLAAEKALESKYRTHEYTNIETAKKLDAKDEVFCNLLNMAKHDELKAIKFYDHLIKITQPGSPLSDGKPRLGANISEIKNDELDHYRKIMDMLKDCIEQPRDFRAPSMPGLSLFDEKHTGAMSEQVEQFYRDEGKTGRFGHCHHRGEGLKEVRVFLGGSPEREAKIVAQRTMKCPKCGETMVQPYPKEEPAEYSCPDCELDVRVELWE